MQYLKLGVVVAMVALAVSSLTWASPASQAAVCAVAPADVSDAFSSVGAPTGPVSYFWRFVQVLFYAAIVSAAMAGCAIVLASTNLLAWSGEGLAQRCAKIIAMVRDNFTEDPADSVIGYSGSEPVTLASVLSDLSERVEQLEAKTTGLKPPPPPKTLEEQLAEAKAEQARLAEELAAAKQVTEPVKA